MEEIQYKKGLVFMLTKWKYIVIGMLFMAVLSALLLPNLHKNTYIASMSIVLKAVAPESLDENIKQNMQLVYNYNSLLKSDALIAEIIEKNSYKYSIGQVKSMIETEVLEGTSIIDIKVSNSDKVVATQILADMIEKLREEVQNLYFIDNVYTVKNILIEEEENFKLPIIFGAAVIFGGIVAIGVVALTVYFKRVIMVGKEESHILDMEIAAKLKMAKTGICETEAFNNIYLFLIKNSSKVVGIIGDKYCKNKEEIIVRTSKTISADANNNGILIIKHINSNDIFFNTFLEGESYSKKSLKQKKDTIEIYKSKNNNIDILNFKVSESLISFAHDSSYREALLSLFEKYDYVFIDLDNRVDSVETKIFCELCDTVLVMGKNYISKEEEFEKIKGFCTEENVKIIGTVLF